MEPDYPLVTVEAREDGFHVVQKGTTLAICPSMMVASVIAQLLNKWFQKKD